jgi:replicative DNA helicase
VSRTLKCAAKDLGVAVVGLSQLSRAPERRKNPRPVLADLRESGAIEQDADLVLFPYRPKAKGDGDASTRAELILRKQRNGPLGAVPVKFRAEFMSFEPATGGRYA